MVIEIRSRLSRAKSSTSGVARGTKHSQVWKAAPTAALLPSSWQSLQVSCMRCRASRFSISTRPPAGAVLAIRSRAASISCQLEPKVTSVVRP